MFSTIVAGAVLIAALPPAVRVADVHGPAAAASVAAADSTPLLFARAREEARRGRPGAAIDAYLAGAAVAATASDWALYRRDIFWVASKGELKSFDSAAPDTRRELLRTFWSTRDTRDGLPSGGRFIEHVRRLDIALAEYRVHPKRGKAPRSRASAGDGDLFDYTVGRNSLLRDYAPGQGEIDDRGVILVRHGEPDARVAANIGMESWVYERLDRDNLVVHFSENVFDGSSGNTRLIAAPPVAALESLCGLDSQSCAVAQQQYSGAGPERRERLRQRTLAAIRELTTTESAAQTDD